MSTPYVKFNINQHVFVKLKDEGFKRLVKFYAPYTIDKERFGESYYRSKVDAEGYYDFQLHEFMEVFGSVFSDKYPNLFELDVRFYSSDMEPIEDDLVNVEKFCEEDL